MNKAILLLILLILCCSLFTENCFAQNRHAIDSLQNELKKFEENKNRPGNKAPSVFDSTKANILNKISEQYWYHSPDTVIYFAQQSLTIAEKIRFKKGIADAYNSMGVANMNAKKYPIALDDHQKALKIRQETGYKKGIATSYRNIGLVLQNRGNYAEALKYYNLAIRVALEAGEKDLTGKIYNDIGVVYYNQNNLPEAINNYQKAIQFYGEADDKVGLAGCYNNTALINQTQQNYAEEIKNYRVAVKFYEETGNKNDEAGMYIGIGLAYYYQANSSEELKNYFEALKLYEETGNKEDIADTYNRIGNVYFLQANYPEALKTFFLALKTDEEMGYKNAMADSYNNIGRIYMMMGNNSESLKNHRAALKINDEIKDFSAMAYTYIYMAEVTKGIKDYTEAMKNIELAMDICNKLNNKSKVAACYYVKANIYDSKGDDAEAIKNGLIALQIYEEIGEQSSIAATYVNISEYYNRAGKFSEARKYGTKGLALVLQRGEKENAKEAYENLAQVYAGLHSYKEAYENEVLFKQLYDTIYNKENDKKITGLQMQYDFDKKQQADSIQHASENKINLLNLHKQKIFTSMGIGGLALVMLLLFFVYRNFTNQRKATADMAIARQRAEQSEKYKEQFLANMSHEIRTPMNAVMGMTNLLIDKNPRSDQFKYLDGMKKSSETLLHIINDILDISKIEAGKIELEQIDFSLTEVLEQVKQTLLHRAEEKGLHLVTEIDKNVPDIIIGDPVRLNQVLMNLAGNAIKFTEKGSITISVIASEARTTQSVKDDGIASSLATFRIIDTGIGIPKDKLQTVFESFSQAHSSDTRKFGGTGLGLAISKQLVELMGGTISIESEEGSGSAFSFEINCPVGSKEKVEKQNTAEQIDGSVLTGLKVLVVDDNEYNRTVARDTLISKADVEITEAVNGKEAIALLEKQEFDIILMDVQMPVMDGYEATRQIRNMTSAKNKIPIIALTASVIRSDLDKCRVAGMTDYVPKPFKASQLISAIAKAIGREIKAGAKKVNETKKVSTVTDLAYLEKFCEGDKVRMNKYISMFLETAPALIEKINTSLLENKFEEIANQIHGYKTKWIMMGMNESKDLALKIERQCRDGAEKQEATENISVLIKQIRTGMNELG